ncbi:hypothetical protein C5167_020554 [Papaver somniferum]|uniref:Uncharacterized protein n=1 Tax=Papaver somniferum TaxID=3469 RepID=A0A4Y7ITW6_PAPSO|nr:hypothetical protein C5167_020554 [Papaver somniferum]
MGKPKSEIFILLSNFEEIPSNYCGGIFSGNDHDMVGAITACTQPHKIVADLMAQRIEEEHEAHERSLNTDLLLALIEGLLLKRFFPRSFAIRMFMFLGRRNPTYLCGVQRELHLPARGGSLDCLNHWTPGTKIGKNFMRQITVNSNFGADISRVIMEMDFFNS